MGSDISLLAWEQQEGMTFTDTNGVAATGRPDSTITAIICFGFVFL